MSEVREFTCPICMITGDTEASGPRLSILVCPGCGSYIAQVEGGWSAVPYEALDEMSTARPDLLAGLEACRLQLVVGWANGTIEPPTPYAYVMAQMYELRGAECLIFRKGGRQ